MLRASEIGREHCEVSYGYYYMGILEHNFEYTKLSVWNDLYTGKAKKC